MPKVSGIIFNQLMKNAIEIRKILPWVSAQRIAELVMEDCHYQDVVNKDDDEYHEVLFQIVINLVNAGRN